MSMRTSIRSLFVVICGLLSMQSIAQTSLPRIGPADVSGRPRLCYDIYCWNWLLATSGSVTIEGSSSGVVGILNRTGANTWVGGQALFNPDEGGFPDGPPNPEYHNFGAPAAISGRVLLISGGSALHPSAVYVFTRPAKTWIHFQTIVLPDGDEAQDIAMDGNTALILGNNAVYEYTRQTAQPFVLAGEIAGAAGYRIALQSNIAAILGSTDEGLGAVYVWWRTSAGWTLKQTLTGSDSQPGDGFGAGFAFDGATIVVSAPQRVNGADPWMPGAVYTFTRRREFFVERDILVHVPLTPPPQWEPGIQFGETLALSGKRLLVDSGRPIGDPPLVTLFERRNERWVATAHMGCLNINEILVGGSGAVITYRDFSRPGSTVSAYALPPLGTAPPATSYECE